MEVFLLIVICLQFTYMVYKDVLFSKEREKLQLKLMSKDVFEYTRAIEPPAKEEEPKKQEDEYLPIEDVSVDRVVNAKVNL